MEPARSALRQLFPTPVGVCPGRAFRGEVSRTLPHARGGVSTFRSTSPALVSSSPRPWGWFRPHVRLRTAGGVFLTPMGMAPPRTRRTGRRCPRTRRSRFIRRPLRIQRRTCKIQPRSRHPAHRFRFPPRTPPPTRRKTPRRRRSLEQRFHLPP